MQKHVAVLPFALRGSTYRSQMYKKLIIFALLTVCVFVPMHSMAKDISIGIFGTWGKDRKDLMSMAKKSGYQIVVSSDIPSVKANNLKCIYPLWLTKEIVQNEANWQRFIGTVRARVIEFKNEPAIMAWYVVDEPDWHQIPIEKINHINEVIRSSGSDKPTFTVLTIPDAWSRYLPHFDIIAIDPYLEMAGRYRGREIDKVSDWIKKIKKDLTNLKLNKPLWIVLGAFELKGKTAKDKSAFRKPTPEEFIKMVDIAKKEEVDGILVFSLTILEDQKYFEWNLMKDDPALWEAVRKLPETLN